MQLYHHLLNVKADDSYERLNEYIRVFTEFVLQNKFLWHMLFNFHLNCTDRSFSVTYLRRVSMMILLLEKNFSDLFGTLDIKKRHAFVEVLWISLFSLSSLLTTSALETYSKMSQTKICTLLLNTYLSGVKVSERVGQYPVPSL